MMLCFGCRPSDPDGAFVAVDADGWKYGDTLEFALQPADSVWHGDIALSLRHTSAYPYSNVWLEISYLDGDSITADTINVVLADDFGNWLGKGLGLSFQRVDTVLKGLSIATPATFSVRHIMRNDRLTDIEQIGLIYLPSPTNN